MEERNRVVIDERKKIQGEYEKLIKENKYLRQENKILHYEHGKLREIFIIAKVEFEKKRDKDIKEYCFWEKE